MNTEIKHVNAAIQIHENEWQINVCSSPEQEAFIRVSEPPNVGDNFPVGILDSEGKAEHEKCLVFRV